MNLQAGQHIFLVGIGGSGLSAIARVLLGQGYRVSGSDRSLNDQTEALARDGATIYKGHDAAQIAGADALIITSAVKDDHVEVAAARAAGIPVYKRQDIMADLMEGKTVIAVAGTKGKTTTTAMIVHILRECGQDPSYIVGGIMGNTGTNAGVGKGSVFVVEADEYDNMFLGLKPDIAVITNIEWDHPDFFKTEADMNESFEKFVNNLPPQGVLIGCVDDFYTLGLLENERLQNPNGDPTTPPAARRTFIGYGTFDPFIPEIRGYNQHIDEEGRTVFDILYQTIRLYFKVGTVRFPLPGNHNVLNAMAALLASNVWCQNNVVFDRQIKALETFKPTARRFELRADVGGVAIVDDYAHNPMSIRAVMEAARQRYPDRAVWAVWQPHTYSRTQALFDQFTTAFAEADHVLVTDIYAARENPIEGVTSEIMVAAIKHADARHTPTFADAVAVLSAEVTASAVVVIMSAGDAPQIGIEYLKHLQTKAG